MPARPPGDAGKAAGQSPDKPSAKRCPTCGKPVVEAFEPFCSGRCRDVDLNRWLSDSYVIPGKPNDEEDAE